MSLNFGDVLGAGCWDCWWRAGTAGTKNFAIFWNGSCHRTTTQNISGFPDISFQNIAEISFPPKFWKRLLTDILDEGGCVSSQPSSARTFRADLHASPDKEDDKTNRTGPDNPTSEVQVKNVGSRKPSKP